MPTVKQLRFPPIADDNLFEDFCRDLWEIIWNDPTAQRNGRSGQAQCGVDVFGIPNGKDFYEGVQSKAIDVPLTDAQIQHEIDEAKKFNPPLHKLIIATTAGRDANGQKYVRAVNLLHRKQKLFSVELLGWDDILDRIQDHLATSRPDLITEYFEVTVSSTVILEGVAQLFENVGLVAGNGAQHRLPVNDLELSTDLPITEERHRELNYARTLINDFKPQQALEYLAHCKDQFWTSATSKVKFRLLHYIGFAHYQLDHPAEAGSAFVEALQYNPDDEAALTFAALGYLLLGQPAEAENKAKEALAKNPTNPKARTVLIETSSTTLSFDDLVATVPEPYRRFPEVANALCQQAVQRNDLVKAEYWIRVSLEGKENWNEFHAMLGQVLLSHATGPIVHPMLFQLTPDRRTQLVEAVEELTKAWDYVTGTEIELSKISWLANRSIAHLMLGEIEQATADIEILRKLDPNNPAWVLRRAEVAMQVRDENTAKDLLSKGPIPTENNDLLAWAALLMEVGQFAEAEEQVGNLLLQALPEPFAILVKRLQVEIAAQQVNFARVEELMASLLAEHGEDVTLLVQAARLARMQNNIPLALKRLDEAGASAGTTSAGRIHLIIADEYYSIEEYDIASRHYEQVADKTAHSALTRRLLICYFRSEQLDKCLELARSLIARYGPLPTISEMASKIYEEAGDLPQARRIAEEYLAIFKNDLPVQLHLAFIYVKIENLPGIDNFLNTTSVDVVTFSLENLHAMAELYAYRGRIDEALGIAYETLRRFSDNSAAHLLLMSIIVRADHSREPDPLMPQRVALDTAVSISDADGTPEWHIIEDRNDYRHPLELAPTNSLAEKLMGCTVGDTIELGDGFGSQTIVIRAIQSKYVYRFQESLETFQRLFPDTPSIARFKVSTSADHPQASDFQPLFDILDRQSNHREQVIQLYREGKITLGTVAKLSSSDLMSTWWHVTSNPTIGLNCTSGNPNDLEAALRILDSGGKLILDPTSFLTLHGLDSRDKLTEAFGPFGIPQAMTDWVRTQIHDARLHPGDGYNIVGKEGSQYVRQEITANQIQQHIEYLESLLAWLNEYTEILPANVALGPRRQMRIGLQDVIPAGFIDAIFIASEEGHILYSDDAVLRALSVGEFSKSGVWTQVLLQFALSKGILSSDEYSADTIRLVHSNYRHTSINSEVVMMAARRADWHAVPPFTTVVEVLSGSKSDQSSAIDVAVQVIFGVWMQPLMDHQRDFLLQSILAQLCAGRSSVFVLRELLFKLTVRFKLHPIGLNEVIQSIQTWSAIQIV